MRYRVAFAKRVQSDGLDSTMRPSAELDLNLSDGVVAEKVFIEQLETEAQHGQEVLDEDDSFLGSAAPEVWEYEVVDERGAEFERALKGSELVLEYDIVDSTVTETSEAKPAAPGNPAVYPPDGDRRDTAEPNGIEDLHVTTADDPRLGLTNRGEKPAQDWAANTGPTRNP